MTWGVTAATLGLLAALALAAEPVKVKKPTIAEPATQQPATPEGPIPTLGNPDSVRWTATTLEAASAEANRKVLATGKPAKVTGEVVDVSCYLQLGKRGPAHVACGTRCIMNGQPVGLVDADDNLYILMAEEHHPRRDGTLPINTVFVPLLSKTVTVNGMMVEMKGYRALFVRAAELCAPTRPAVQETK
jgi:hypothetical protein